MVRDGKVYLRQWKNRSKQPVDVVVPILPELEAALKGWQGKGLTWLETPAGSPYSVDGFRVRFREWCNAAGLHHCSFHGLRKATAARMAERGRTPHQIMSVLGHSTHQQAATYTKKADRERMAGEALTGLFVPERMSQPKTETKRRKKA